MNVHRITKDQVRDGMYVGSVDLSGFIGSVEADENLGTIVFGLLSVSDSIYFKAGSGIKAGWSIQAGEGIEAGLGIEAGRGIQAGGGIEAGRGIEAGLDIKAGRGIQAGDGIEAGLGIEAGWGIQAGWSIESDWLKAKLRIFAGLCSWRLASEEECEIRSCVKEGIVALGRVIVPIKQ